MKLREVQGAQCRATQKVPQRGLVMGENTNGHESEESSEERRLTTKDELTEFLLYTAPDGQVKVECILHDETIWLT